MDHPRWPLIVLLALGALWSAGCYAPASGEEPSGVIASGTGAIATATPVYAIPTVVVLSVETPEPSTATPTPTPAPVAATVAPTATPAATATPVGTATPKPTNALPSGSPFGAADLMAAVASRGAAYEQGEVRAGCIGEASGAHRYSSDDGPQFTLWVYPSGDALEADWVLPSSGAASPRIAGCEIDGGWVYWHENLVVAFEPQQPWIEASSLREAIVDALWSLSR